MKDDFLGSTDDLEVSSVKKNKIEKDPIGQKKKQSQEQQDQSEKKQTQEPKQLGQKQEQPKQQVQSSKLKDQARQEKRLWLVFLLMILLFFIVFVAALFFYWREGKDSGVWDRWFGDQEIDQAEENLTTLPVNQKLENQNNSNNPVEMVEDNDDLQDVSSELESNDDAARQTDDALNADEKRETKENIAQNQDTECIFLSKMTMYASDGKHNCTIAGRFFGYNAEDEERECVYYSDDNGKVKNSSVECEIDEVKKQLKAEHRDANCEIDFINKQLVFTSDKMYCEINGMTGEIESKILN
ncbi:MAG: hypothetical protein GF332_03625 [Candidatus Moranbacteria bacterium]|nr:hypothetical protein [Candidatus Moranbacteria bacterium]